MMTSRLARLIAPLLLCLGLTQCSASEPAIKDGLSSPYPAPEFAGIKLWLNSPPLTLAALKGKVVLIDFWTYSCVNCVRTLPWITRWDASYRDKGLVIIGVHSPEFDFEKSPDNVRAALSRYGIRYPVALDSDMATWGQYNNRFWPAHYLIDQQGRVVYTHFGEGHYEVTENAIRYLLGIKTPVKATEAPPPFKAGQTPETYLGLERTERFGGKEDGPDTVATRYQLPDTLDSDHWALGGDWKAGRQSITSTRPGSVLRLHFTARKVFLVLGTASGHPARVSLTLNGFPVGANAGHDAPDGTLLVKRHALYELIDQKAIRSGVLDIRTDTPGLEAYAFTFGS